MDKSAVREAVWDAFEETGAARFPFPPHGRIPNFAGADAACERLADTGEWAAASTLKCNPDAPQLPVRRAALRAGKTVYVAQPRLRDPNPFLRLDPAEIPPAEIDDATTVSGIGEHGVPTAPEDVSRVDLVISGSVGVATDGARIGKGEGYGDLEWGVLRELEAVDEGTTVATTVHELSVLDGPQSAVAAAVDAGDALPAPDDHDVPLDLIATPERTIRTETSYPRPDGIDWDALDAARLNEIPVLAERAPEGV